MTGAVDDELPTLDPDRDSTLILLVGRKGSGKSVAARELYRSWDQDKLVIDVNGDADPGPDAQRIQVPLPSKFPAGAGPLVNEPAKSLHFRADPGAPTYRDDLDRAIGLALYPQDLPVLVWIDEIGEVCKGANSTPPNLRRLLMQSRHYRASALMCGPRPMNIDPLAISQADLIYIFDVPNPRDRDRLAENMGYPPRRLAAELEETRRRGKYWFLLWDANAGVPYRMPPIPVTSPSSAPAR